MYRLIYLLAAAVVLSACRVGGAAATATAPAAHTATPSSTALPETSAALLTASPSPIPTITASPEPVVTAAELKALVTPDRLSCRYGPGPEYLYLYGLRKGANIVLIGRTDGNHWVWVAGKNKCWVNASYLQITGDPKALPLVYPGTAKLPVTPYYPAPAWASAVRSGNSVTVEMAPVPISAGDYEDASMHQYILEVWRCEAGQIIFETLGSNTPSITVPKDEAGCSIPSHGRVFVQEVKPGVRQAMEDTLVDTANLLAGLEAYIAANLTDFPAELKVERVPAGFGASVSVPVRLP